MFTLAKTLWELYVQRAEFYVIILGLDNAGKTTLLESIKAAFGQPALARDKIGPTVGLNVGKVHVDANTRLSFWDLGGQRDLRSIWEKYYPECHGILFVIDGTDRERLQEVKETCQQLMTRQEIEGVPILMLVNKQDLEETMELADIKEIFNAIALHLGARDSKVLGISALHGDNVRASIDWLTLRLKRNAENRPPLYRT